MGEEELRSGSISKMELNIRCESNPIGFYDNLKTYASVLNDGSVVVSNEKFFAYTDSNGSGSCVGVLPLTSFGKNHVPVNSPAYQQPLIRAHSQVVQDIAFDPFNSNRLFTCSGDKYLKIWNIPRDGLVTDVSAADAALMTKSKVALRGVLPHFAASDLLVARSSREFALFDLTTNTEMISSASNYFNGDMLSMTWSSDGRQLISTSKDKTLRIFDLRLPAENMLVASAPAHSGICFAYVVSLNNENLFVTLGHDSTTNNRELWQWDRRSLATGPTGKHIFDQLPAPLVPLYDRDLDVLIVGDRTGSKLRVGRSTADSPFQQLAETNVVVESAGKDIIRAMSILPKQSLDFGRGEVMKVLKLSDGRCQPISIVAPALGREGALVNDIINISSESILTRYGAPPTLSSSAWLGGENFTSVNTISIAVQVVATANTETAVEVNTVTGADESVADVAEGADAEVAGSKRASSRIASGLGSLLKYRHMHGREAVKDMTYYNLQPDLSALDTPIIAADEAFWAIPYRGGGGPVYVSRHSQVGKVLPDCITINGHRAAVTDIAFSPFHTGLMATGSIDSHIKLWDLENLNLGNTAGTGKLSKEGTEEQTRNEYEAITDITAHRNSIRSLLWHPVIPGLLCSSSQDMTIRFFDINNSSEALSTFSLLPHCNNETNALITNTSFNYDGTLLAFAAKDRIVRVLDPRQGGSGALIATSPSDNAALGRNLRVYWCARSPAGYDPLVTTSLGSGGLRNLAVWDLRKFTEPMAVKSIDNASGQLFPIYDEYLNLLILAGKGDMIIRSYEIMNLTQQSEAVDETQPSSYLIEKSAEFQSSGREPIAGICMLPKRCCDVRNIEAARLLKLTSDSVIPISFKVPRADHLKEYFHDDLYPPIRSKTESNATIVDWTNPDTAKEVFRPVLESIKPEDMVNVSDRPPEPAPSTTNSKVNSFRMSQQQKVEAEQQREQVFGKLQKLANQSAQYNKNLSGPIKIGGVIVNQQAADEDSDDNDWDS